MYFVFDAFCMYQFLCNESVYETFLFENSLARPTSWMARTPFRNVATFF